MLLNFGIQGYRPIVYGNIMNIIGHMEVPACSEIKIHLVLALPERG